MPLKGGNKMVQASNYLDGRIGRTKVGRHFKWRTTFNSGYMIPFWCDEILPGQSKSVDLGELVRSITPLGPTMDNSFLDLFFFFVPNRLLWDHWEEFIAGYNKEAWTQDVVYQVPQVYFSASETDICEPHSFYDYLPGLGNPEDLNTAVKWAYAGSDTTEVLEREAKVKDVFGFSALYPRAYIKIWNDWFRDENLQDEIQLYTGDYDEGADSFAFNLLKADALLKLGKYHNRFTSCLPQPQKGPDVLIPMDGLSIHATASSDAGAVAVFAGSKGPFSSGDTVDLSLVSSNGTELGSVYAKNVSNTIRQLRLATQTELLLARDARGGTRYVESLLAHFGVHNGDARLQRSEYLGSKQIPLQIMQVTNTAGTSSDPLGNVGGQSVTKDNHHFFMKSFSEHGIVFCVGGVRTNISYSHGIRKMYQRKDRFDFIWPEFRHIGDVPCYTKELAQIVGSKATSASDPTYAPVDNDKVFGYTPYASEIRDGYNFNNGLFRDNASGSLSYLTYQEAYDFYRTGVGTAQTNVPTLSDGWIKQDSNILLNTLIDQSGPQFYALFDLYSEDVIPVDPTSDPGLMDHF